MGEGKRVSDTGNNTTCAKTEGAIKILTAFLELQAVDRYGVLSLEGELEK